MASAARVSIQHGGEAGSGLLPQTVVSKGPRPAIWPVLGTAVEMKRIYRRLNDWFLSYFSDDVKSWKYRLSFLFSQTVGATFDPVVVEYILTNYHIYGKWVCIQDTGCMYEGDGYQNTGSKSEGS